MINKRGYNNLLKRCVDYIEKIKNEYLMSIDTMSHNLSDDYKKTKDERYLLARKAFIYYINELLRCKVCRDSDIQLYLDDMSKYRDIDFESNLSKDKVYSSNPEGGPVHSRLATVKDRKEGINGGFDH